MSDSVKGWPKDWNDGARSSVEPFLHAFFGIKLDETWNWLLQHGELRATPDSNYNPTGDATCHVVPHRAIDCQACALWSMLVVLWTVSRELYDLRNLRLAMQLGTKALRLTLEIRGYVEAISQPGNAPKETNGSGTLTDNVVEAARQLELFTADVHTRFSPDARDALRGGRQLLGKIYRSLHDANFSYAEIAELLGDSTKGASDRIRMRSARSK